jgi:phosphate transport system protein
MLPHTRAKFDKDLQRLSRLVAEMGGLAEQQLLHAFKALSERNARLAGEVIGRDCAVDAFHSEMEKESVNIIAQCQPLAVDLRATVSALHISDDLERIGDLAKNVSKRVIEIGLEVIPKSIIRGLEHMTKMVLGQIQEALDSYASRDIDQALAVRNGDQKVDALNNSLFHETLKYMEIDPHHIAVCTHILFCIKNLERIGDHATNIAEMVYYIGTGHVPTDERPKTDTTGFRRRLHS